MKKNMIADAVHAKPASEYYGIGGSCSFSQVVAVSHSASLAPSGGGMSFINLKGDEAFAQTGGGWSFIGKITGKINTL